MMLKAKYPTNYQPLIRFI